MASKLSILILGLVLIVPYLNAAPAPKSSEASSEEIFSKPVVERFKILMLTLEEFASLCGELSKSGPDVLKAVLADPAVTADKSEENQKYLKELSDFVEKINKINKDEEKDEIFDMLEEFSAVVKKFDSEDNKDLSPAALAIEKSLKENGLTQIEEKIKEHFVSFLGKFKIQVEEYFSGLNEKEREVEKEFIEWFEKLKAETDLEKQSEMFDKFIDTDSNESN